MIRFFFLPLFFCDRCRKRRPELLQQAFRFILRSLLDSILHALRVIHYASQLKYRLRWRNLTVLFLLYVSFHKIYCILPLLPLSSHFSKKFKCLPVNHKFTHMTNVSIIMLVIVLKFSGNSCDI